MLSEPDLKVNFRITSYNVCYTKLLRLKPAVFVKQRNQHAKNHEQIAGIGHHCAPIIVTYRQYGALLIGIVRRLKESVSSVIQYVVHVNSEWSRGFSFAVGKQNFAGIRRWAV